MKARRRRARTAAVWVAIAATATPIIGHAETASDLETPGSVSSQAAATLRPGTDETGQEPPAEASARLKSGSGYTGLRGFVQTELARTVTAQEHWSKMLTRAELGTTGRSGELLKWKVSARLDYDAVYDLYDTYPADVRKDQRLNLVLRENYVDFAAGNWDFRIGRQQVVWGEIVGFFVADVVSAKDLREFILPEFEILRIPQWAARAEYSSGNVHAELLWIPVPSYDKIGKPGAEFFPSPPPAPPGFATTFRGESRPKQDLSNTNYGARIGALVDGWDLSGFYYRSTDASPTFYREVVAAPQPSFVYQARHDRIHQVGTTVTKDFESFVFKGEGVYTHGRRLHVLRASDEDGVVPQNAIDWVVGLDFTPTPDTRFNVQFFQRAILDRDPDVIPRARENGYTIFLSHKLTERLEAQVLWISSLNRTDWLFRPRVNWNFEANWRFSAGADVFHGPPVGVFGRFDNRDRVYAEVRYSF
jgi:hypothetical protein